MDQYQHFITKNIKAFYKKRLPAPILYLILLIILWFVFPLQALMMPRELPPTEMLGSGYDSDDSYVHATFTDLRFSGFTRDSRFGNSGYYYYGSRENQCYFLLLSPKTCDEGLPSIDSVTINAKIMKGGDSYQQLLGAMSEKLEWTTSGINAQMPTYFYSEPDYHPWMTRILLIFFFASMIYCVCSIALYSIYICFPVLSPPCLDLIIFGSPKAILQEAEEELATLPQLATEDMFITEHYFILTSPYGNAIVPIDQILWIYKHSTLHKFLWYHFSISYTMHIVAHNHFYVECPKNLKSDIDGIIDYLAEANHQILVGFDEKNRLAVEQIVGMPFHIEKLIALLKHKPKWKPIRKNK